MVVLSDYAPVTDVEAFLPVFTRRSLLPVLLLSMVVSLTALPTSPASAGGKWEGVVDITFPVTGDDYRYINDYHYSRSRGAHGATDIMAPPGTPIVAAQSGTITWVSTPATSGCGYCLDIKAPSGRTYGYIHLGPNGSGNKDKAFARNWKRGDTVKRGQVIGYNGCSGNASCSPGGHHLHFIIEDSGVRDPYGDARRNPYPSLKAAEKRGSCRTTRSFDDVCVGSTHAKNIQRLFGAGLTKGCDTNSFCPNDPIERDQMATFLVRALELRGLNKTPFRDVDRGNVHYRQIARLAKQQITKGCDGRRYCPDRGVTRAQMATFIAKALDLPARSSPRFRDVPRSNVHAGNISAIARAGITSGCGNGKYCPDEIVTREQMATFLVNAFLD